MEIAFSERFPCPLLLVTNNTNDSQSDYVPQERYSGRWKVTLTCFIIHFFQFCSSITPPPSKRHYFFLFSLHNVLTQHSSSTSGLYSGEVQITCLHQTMFLSHHLQVSTLILHYATAVIHWLTVQNSSEAKLVFKMSRHTQQTFWGGRKTLQ